MTNEIWKDIPEYEGLYEVSNHGRVKSRGKRILAPGADAYGYPRASLSKDGVTTIVKVHRLVGQAFLGLDINDPSQVINHLDENVSNNHVSNLEITDTKGNNRHSKAKLNLQQVDEIKQLLAKRVSQRNIANQYGISQSVVSEINTNKLWA